MATLLWATREKIERARESDFSRLEGQVYLDHAGAAQYPTRLLRAYLEDLSSHLYSNPHSGSLSGAQVGDIIQSVRCKVLQHFNTTPDQYEVIFTSGCTGALKLLAESFDFGPNHGEEDHRTGAKERHGAKKKSHDDGTKERKGETKGPHGIKDNQCNSHNEVQYEQGSPYDYTTTSKIFSSSHVGKFSGGGFFFLNDNHTSVMGMREVAAERGASVSCFTEEEIVDFFRNDSENKGELLKGGNAGFLSGRIRGGGNSLFAYPAQSNFCGRKYPLEWIHRFQGMTNSDKVRNCVVLDAACFVTSSKLDLNKYKPDFVSLSFYKMFGFPTGLGALLVKKDNSHLLKKTYFGGGTVKVAVPGENFHVSKDTLSERFEDGTVNYLDILALRHAFETFYDITGGLNDISEYVFLLSKLLYRYLKDCIHFNGNPVAVIYSDAGFNEASRQGPIIAFNILRSNGEHMGFSEVSKLAQLYNVHLRTGCFCNLGGCQRHLKMSDDHIKKNFQQGHVCGDEVDLVDGLPTGALRVSLGYSTVLKDICSFIEFVEECLVEGGRGMDSVAIKEFVENMWDDLASSHSHSLVSNDHHNMPSECETLAQNLQGGKHLESLEVGSVVGLQLATNQNVNHSKMPTAVHVSRIIVYPVKSCGAFVTDSWEIGPRGLLFDREWMVVDSSGINLSQKKCPSLVHILPSIDLQKGLLTLSYPGMESVSVPLQGQFEGQGVTSQMTCLTPVCRDTVKGHVCDLEVSEWLQEALGAPGLQLVQQDPSLVRTAKRKPVAGKSGSSISLANESQYLLISENSVREFHNSMREQALKDQIDPDSVPTIQNLIARFRANLVIAGNVAPYEEETWRTVSVEGAGGRSTFNVQGGCKRCQVICTDQNTGERQKDVFRTLSAVTDRKVTFGVLLNNAHMDGVRRISVGDTITAQGVNPLTL